MRYIIIIGILAAAGIGYVIYSNNQKGSDMMAAGHVTEGLIPFTQEAFQQAQNENKKIVLQFHATWCTTCKAQAKSLQEIVQEGRPDLIVFQVDYDRAVDMKTAYNVTAQSTMIFMQGNKEIARATGVTNKDDIKSLL